MDDINKRLEQLKSLCGVMRSSDMPYFNVNWLRKQMCLEPNNIRKEKIKKIFNE